MLRTSSADRRQFAPKKAASVSCAVVGLLVVWLSVLGSQAGASRRTLEDTVVFAGPGGIYQTTFTTKIFPIFTKQTGVKVQYVAGGADANLVTIRAQASNPTVDVYWGSPLQLIRGRGLFKGINLKDLPNTSLLAKTYAVRGTPSQIPMVTLASGLFYNVPAFASRGWDPPTKWSDLWDPKYKGYAGVPGLPSATTEETLVYIAKLHGGGEKNIDPGMQQFAKLKPDLFSAPPAANVFDTQIVQGNILIGTYHAARVEQLINSGVPLKFVKPSDGVPVLLQTAAIPVNDPHPNAALALINFLLSPGIQRAMPSVFGYGPTTTGHGVSVLPQFKSWISGSTDPLAFNPNWSLVAKYDQAWTQNWNNVMA